jgi:hypothetical protein
MASSHFQQPAPANNHIDDEDDGNHLSAYKKLLPDESLAPSSKLSSNAWNQYACGVFAIIRILRFVVKNDQHPRFPDFPRSAHELEVLKKRWSILMTASDSEAWPATELTFIERLLRTYSIYLMQGKVAGWCDLNRTTSMADYASRSLRKLCDSKNLWKTKDLFAVVIVCISCTEKKENCHHSHMLTIESTGVEDGLVLSDQGGIASTDKFCTVYECYVVTGVFKVKHIDPEKVERLRSQKKARS